MDCMDLLKQIPDKYFELAIDDPPYGINLANMKMGVGKSKKSSSAKNRKWIAKDWDLTTPNDEYFRLLNNSSREEIVWGGNYFNLPSCLHYIIWDKEIPTGLSFADCEMAWTTFSKAPRIFRYSAYLDKRGKTHPTQKPIALYEWILKNYAKPNDKILDTHLGSGSSRIAADKANLPFVGCELDADYFYDSVKRFNNYSAQQTIF